MIHWNAKEKALGGSYMKNDVILYEKIYYNLKNKIECGLFPEGHKLPSRTNMCKEYGTSEKPVRRAMEMLAEERLIEIKPRRRPTVACHTNAVHKAALHSMEKVAAIDANDALKSGVLLCYPLIGHGISLCSGEDWLIPETILALMNPEQPSEFWHLSNRFWRFFVARNSNEYMLRIVDSMGYSELEVFMSTVEERSDYLATLGIFLKTVEKGGDPASVRFEDMSFLYGFGDMPSQDTAAYVVPSDSLFLLGAGQLEQRIRRGEERYSSVYLDIIGLIAIGFYQRGDLLPSHKKLQEIYGVSIDTTIKAIKTLKEWGVVDASPHRGIWVTMERQELKQINLDPEMIACHVRRFLDSLELLTLTMEGVAVHAMAHIQKKEAEQLCSRLESCWNDPLMFHFFPSALLKFITEHIQYEMLRTIFEILRSNFRIGRSIPKLIGSEKTQADHENYRKCLTAAEHLANGDSFRFARLAARLFQDIRLQIITACREHGYWDAAMHIYEGTALWK